MFGEGICVMIWLELFITFQTTAQWLCIIAFKDALCKNEDGKHLKW